MTLYNFKPTIHLKIILGVQKIFKKKYTLIELKFM